MKINGKAYCDKCIMWCNDYYKSCPKCNGKLADHFTGYIGEYLCSKCGRIDVCHSGPNKRNKRCVWCGRFTKFLGKIEVREKVEICDKK